jgi:hypothetical protein
MSHFLLAATGLVLWIIYVVTDSSALAWIPFILLLVVATLGFTMFAIWLRRRRATALEAVTPDTPAEQHFPVSVVALHGVLAATTLLLVLLTAVGFGGS